MMRVLIALLLLISNGFGELIEDLDIARHSRSSEADKAYETAQQRVSSGYLLLKKGKKELALKLFQDAVQFDPTSHECWTGLGSIQVDMGNVKEARASLERALALAPPRKSLPKNIIKLQESVEESMLNPTSLADCDYANFFETRIGAMTKELKKGKKLSKDNLQWTRRLKAAMDELTEAGFEWDEEEPPSMPKKENKKKSKTGKRQR